MKYLIVGLGNTGDSYALTRHNIGFMAIDHMVISHDAKAITTRRACKAEINYKGRRIHLIKPTGFMNQSGKAVSYWMSQLAIPKNNLLIIVDDIALPFGHIRLRGQGSPGGHNGLKDIESLLQGNDFPRLRVGIGNDFLKGQQAEYVLGQFNRSEREGLPKLLEKIAQTVHSFCFLGLDRAMNAFNSSLS